MLHANIEFNEIKCVLSQAPVVGVCKWTWMDLAEKVPSIQCRFINCIRKWCNRCCCCCCCWGYCRMQHCYTNGQQKTASDHIKCCRFAFGSIEISSCVHCAHMHQQATATNIALDWSKWWKSKHTFSQNKQKEKDYSVQYTWVLKWFSFHFLMENCFSLFTGIESASEENTNNRTKMNAKPIFYLKWQLASR